MISSFHTHPTCYSKTTLPATVSEHSLRFGGKGEFNWLAHWSQNNGDAKEAVRQSRDNPNWIIRPGQESPTRHLRDFRNSLMRHFKVIADTAMSGFVLFWTLVPGAAAMTYHHRITESNRIIQQLQSQQETTPDPDSQGMLESKILDQQQKQKFNQIGRAFMGLTSGGMASLIGTAVIYNIYRIRKTITALRQLEGKLLNLKPESDPLQQRYQGILQKRVDLASGIFADRLQKLYQSNPQVRPNLEAVFGNPPELPKADDVFRLFQYYAYLQILYEQGFPRRGADQPVSEFTLLKRTFLLMQSGQLMGELFAYIEKAQPAPGKPHLTQQLNESLMAQIQPMMQTLEDQLEDSLGKVLLRETELEGQWRMNQVEQDLQAGKISDPAQLTLPQAEREKLWEALAKEAEADLAQNSVPIDLTASYLVLIGMLQDSLSTHSLEAQALKIIEEQSTRSRNTGR